MLVSEWVYFNNKQYFYCGRRMLELLSETFFFVYNLQTVANMWAKLSNLKWGDSARPNHTVTNIWIFYPYTWDFNLLNIWWLYFFEFP